MVHREYWTVYQPKRHSEGVQPCADLPYACQFLPVRPQGTFLVTGRVMDHTSICALIEAKWNLPAITYRDANAWPMLDMLDPGRPAFLTPPELAQPLLDTDPSALACNVSEPGTIPPPGSVTPPRPAGPAGPEHPQAQVKAGWARSSNT
jgi:hypothetical protein